MTTKQADKWMIPFLLLIVFSASFIIATGVFDMVSQARGFYTQGIEDERSLENDCQ